MTKVRNRNRLVPSKARLLVGLVALLALVAGACGSDDSADESSVAADSAADSAAESTEETSVEATATAVPEADEPAPSSADPSATTVRESGATVTVQPAGDSTVHSFVAPEQVFANATHIVELANSLVVIDTQFLLPNALDFRAYADGLGKPIDRVFITHEHPDHFLGSEAFNDVPQFALGEVAEKIAANGQAEIDEKQADFGPAIASTFVTPETIEPGTVVIDGTSFELERVVDAESEVQLVVRVPDAGVIATGDIIYSGVHLILAGPIDTWTAVIDGLAATADEYPIVLPGHGAPTDPTVYDANTAWLAKAGELLGTVDNSADFKQGLVDAFPELGMDQAIDFVFPFLFPNETAVSADD